MGRITRITFFTASSLMYLLRVYYAFTNIQIIYSVKFYSPLNKSLSRTSWNDLEITNAGFQTVSGCSNVSVCARSALMRVQQCGRSAPNGSFGRCADDGVLTSEQHLSKSDRDSFTRHITCLGAGNACHSLLSRRTIKASFSGPSLFFLASSCPFYLKKEKKNLSLKQPGSQNGRRQVEPLRGRKLAFSSLCTFALHIGWRDI